MTEADERLDKVVVHTKSGIIKGYLPMLPYHNVSDALRLQHASLAESVELHQASSDAPLQLRLDEVKAIFFVKQFEGQPQRRDLRFHSGPVSNGIWVEVAFNDGELVEGIIENALHPLVDCGFFLLPTDKRSNNQLIYVPKHAIAQFRVLGLRQI